MKRHVLRVFTIVLLILSLSLFGGSAAAATPDIDLSALSDEELMALPELVSEEQLRRGLVKSAKLGAGAYIVGKDIPAGDYTVERNTPNSTIVRVFYPGTENISGRVDTSTIKYHVALFNYENETGKLELEDGDILSASSEVILKVFSGVVFE